MLSKLSAFCCDIDGAYGLLYIVLSSAPDVPSDIKCSLSTTTGCELDPFLPLPLPPCFFGPPFPPMKGIFLALINLERMVVCTAVPNLSCITLEISFNSTCGFVSVIPLIHRSTSSLSAPPNAFGPGFFLGSMPVMAMVFMRRQIWETDW